jgi:hypothetical protein
MENCLPSFLTLPFPAVLLFYIPHEHKPSTRRLFNCIGSNSPAAGTVFLCVELEEKNGQKDR